MTLFTAVAICKDLDNHTSWSIWLKHAFLGSGLFAYSFFAFSILRKKVDEQADERFYMWTLSGLLFEQMVPISDSVEHSNIFLPFTLESRHGFDFRIAGVNFSDLFFLIF